MKAKYTEDNFEEYSESLIRARVAEHGWVLNESAMEGSIYNNRDEAMLFDEAKGEITGFAAYTDEDIWDEYLYFVLYETLDDYLESTPFNGRHLGPVHDDQEMTYEMNVYREGDKPFSHYDVGRMDLYRGTYRYNEDGTVTFDEPKKVIIT